MTHDLAHNVCEGRSLFAALHPWLDREPVGLRILPPGAGLKGLGFRLGCNFWSGSVSGSIHKGLGPRFGVGSIGFGVWGRESRFRGLGPRFGVGSIGFRIQTHVNSVARPSAEHAPPNFCDRGAQGSNPALSALSHLSVPTPRKKNHSPVLGSLFPLCCIDPLLPPPLQLTTDILHIDNNLFDTSSLASDALRHFQPTKRERRAGKAGAMIEIIGARERGREAMRVVE